MTARERAEAVQPADRDGEIDEKCILRIQDAIEAAILEDREACAKILDEESKWHGGENDYGYVNSEAEGMLRDLAEAIRKRG